MEETELSVTMDVITDLSGNTFQVSYVDGFSIVGSDKIINNAIRKHFKDIRNLHIRDEDILISAYPKSGTHWIWEVIHMLKSGCNTYHKQIKENFMLDLAPTDEIDQHPSPRILNTHLWIKHFPEEIFQKKTKLIRITRHPKDVAISFYYHIYGLQKKYRYNGGVKDFIYMFLNKEVPFGSWFHYIEQWEDFLQSCEHPIHTVSYEDMIKDPKLNIRQLATFLDLDVSDELVGLIADACSFEQLKKANSEVKDDGFKDLFKEGTSMYRKGKVGDWKNYLTVAENEEFNRILKEKLKNKHYLSKYEQYID